MLGTIVFLVLLAILIGYFIRIYNGLVSLRENVKKAWSNIDVLLKQRHDELPKLIETCKRYMSYEQETLELVMKARAAVSAAQQSGDIKGLGDAENHLRLGLGRLFAVAESYPDLKADETFRHLQQRITGLEEAIADRRELYNEAANINNIRIDVLPDLIVARWFKFREAELLEFDVEETKDVDVKELFG